MVQSQFEEGRKQPAVVIPRGTSETVEIGTDRTEIAMPVTGELRDDEKNAYLAVFNTPKIQERLNTVEVKGENFYSCVSRSMYKFQRRFTDRNKFEIRPPKIKDIPKRFKEATTNDPVEILTTHCARTTFEERDHNSRDAHYFAELRAQTQLLGDLLHQASIGSRKEFVQDMCNRHGIDLYLERKSDQDRVGGFLANNIRGDITSLAEVEIRLKRSWLERFFNKVMTEREVARESEKIGEQYVKDLHPIPQLTLLRKIEDVVYSVEPQSQAGQEITKITRAIEDVEISVLSAALKEAAATKRLEESQLLVDYITEKKSPPDSNYSDSNALKSLLQELEDLYPNQPPQDSLPHFLLKLKATKTDASSQFEAGYATLQAIREANAEKLADLIRSEQSQMGIAQSTISEVRTL